jgi:3-hydroxyacyl-[acyl-carrier-protein] dehydratase
MGSSTTVLIPAQHPAFSGHFPGAPLLPGVVLLDEMLRVVQGAGDGRLPARGDDGDAAAPEWTVATAKFLQPVRPGDTLSFEHEAPGVNGAVRFTIRSAGRAVASGTLIPRLAAQALAPEPDHGHQAG